MATLVYATGWEHGVNPVVTGGGLSSDTGGTHSIDAGIKHSGTSSLKLDGTSAAAWWSPGSFANLSVGSVWLYFGAFPSVDVPYQLSLAGAVDSGVYVDNGGVLHARVGAGTVRNGPTITTGTWVRLEWKADYSGATWTFDWWVDGAAQTQASEAGHAAGVPSVNFGAGGSGIVMYVDDLVISSTLTDAPLGNYTVEGITADQAVAAEHVTTLTGWAYTDNNFTATTGITTSGETASRSRVNVLGDANHGVQNSSASAAGNLRYPIADPANTGVPDVVVCLMACKESGTGTNNATFRTYLSAGVVTNHFSGNPGTTASWNTFSGTTLGYLRGVMSVAPGAVAWTLQRLKDIRFEFASTDGSPAPRLMGFFYEVAFPVTGSTYTKAGYAKENG